MNMKNTDTLMKKKPSNGRVTSNFTTGDGRTNNLKFYRDSQQNNYGDTELELNRNSTGDAYLVRNVHSSSNFSMI